MKEFAVGYRARDGYILDKVGNKHYIWKSPNGKANSLENFKTGKEVMSSDNLEAIYDKFDEVEGNKRKFARIFAKVKANPKNYKIAYIKKSTVKYPFNPERYPTSYKFSMGVTDLVKGGFDVKQLYTLGENYGGKFRSITTKDKYTYRQIKNLKASDLRYRIYFATVETAKDFLIDIAGFEKVVMKK